jgi:hypothetical protein
MHESQEVLTYFLSNNNNNNNCNFQQNVCNLVITTIDAITNIVFFKMRLQLLARFFGVLDLLLQLAAHFLILDFQILLLRPICHPEEHNRD